MNSQLILVQRKNSRRRVARWINHRRPTLPHKIQQPSRVGSGVPIRIRRKNPAAGETGEHANAATVWCGCDYMATLLTCGLYDRQRRFILRVEN
jgi:hypothetical protein